MTFAVSGKSKTSIDVIWLKFWELLKELFAGHSS